MTRVRALAALSPGLLRAGRTALTAAAAAVPGRARDPNTERRFRRWLANRRVPVTALWRPLIRTLLAGRAGTDVLLVLDPTPHNDVATVLTLGVVVHKRVLPVAWHVLPNQEPGRRRQGASVRRLLRVVAPWLPAGCWVTVVADSGLTSPELIALCRERGWHVVLRLSADARQGPLLRDAAGRERPVWGPVTAPAASGATAHRFVPTPSRSGAPARFPAAHPTDAERRAGPGCGGFTPGQFYFRPGKRPSKPQMSVGGGAGAGGRWRAARPASAGPAGPG